MKVAILGAMDQEVALLKQNLSQVNEEVLHHLTVYTGQLSGVGSASKVCWQSGFSLATFISAPLPT